MSETLHLPSPKEHPGVDRATALAEAFVAGMAADFDLASYDFIGFSVLSDTLPTTLGVIQLVRQRYPKVALIAGNHEATVNLQDCIGKSQLDGVILADAEEPVLSLLRGHEPSTIPGVIWRRFNPKPPREAFERWNDAIPWSEIPFEAYWKRTASLYPLDEMGEEERIAKLYEIRTVRIHSLVACELACTYSVAGDTRVFTKDGPVAIASLARGLGEVRACVHGGTTVHHRITEQVATPAGRSTATHAVNEGTHTVLQVNAEYGFSIKATPEHRLLCAVNDATEWKRTDELRVGDFLVIRRPEHEWPTEYQKLTPPTLSAVKYSRRGADAPHHRCPEVLDEALAWLSGYIVGDGCIPQDGRPSFTFIVSPDLERKQHALVRALFNIELKIVAFNHTKAVTGGWVYSRLAREVLVQSLGIDPGDKLKIPPIFWKSPRSVLAAFLAGLHDADAYTDPRRPSAPTYLATISHRLAGDVALAHLMLGNGLPSVNHVVPDNTNGRKGCEHYRVSVTRNDRIPSTKAPYKSSYSGVWYWRTMKRRSAHNNGCVGVRRSSIRASGLGHPLDRDGWYYVRVQSVIACPPEPIFDIAVPGEEAFVANGFVAHNCSVANTRRIASGSMKPSIINLSPDALERTILAIKRQVPGMMTIYDSCDEAWLGRGRAHEYLDVLERTKPEMDKGLPLGIRWLIQCRTNDLDEEIIDRASRCGVRHLTIGVESPIAQVRKDIKKPQGEDLIRNVARWCTARDIDPYMLFIMFLPTITLEQLHEAVVNWRIYMELGATVSVEPFAMAYLGTALHDDASLVVEHANYDIPFSGTPAKRLKWATLIWPNDRRVCAVLQWFRANVDSYIKAALAKLGHRHAFKGTTGRVTVDCLEEALRLYDAGQLPPWQLSGAGERSKVYQDYGDQMSGAEIAEVASEMLRPNITATRFNSTHALLDDSANSGVQGRIKDPALPHEMVPKK